jgi:signal transduction histidine kinase
LVLSGRAYTEPTLPDSNPPRPGKIGSGSRAIAAPPSRRLLCPGVVAAAIELLLAAALLGAPLVCSTASAQTNVRRIVPVDQSAAEGVPANPSVVDVRQLEQTNTEPPRLARGTLNDSRDQSILDRYRFYIIAAVIAIAAQTVLIALLLVQHGRRRQAEAAVWRNQVELRKSYERVRDLGSRLLDAQEHERARIARELHDDISQQLAVLKIELRRLTGRVQGPTAAITARVLKRTDDIARSVYDLSHRLHPARLRLTGLVPSLEGLRAELSRADFRITFSHANIPPTLSTELGLSLYRIVQEALQNAAKHSRARTVSVELRAGAGGLTLAIVDDGIGFDVGADTRSGMGLLSVRERVEAVGGTVEIRSHPGDGTALEVRVPWSASLDQDFVAAG